MRILFVAYSNSVHTARWIRQLDGLGWDLHLFPSVDTGLTHSHFKNITVHHSIYSDQPARDRSVRQRGLPIVFPGLSPYIAWTGRKALKYGLPGYHSTRLRRLIDELRPDIIHSMPIQPSGYLVSSVSRKYTSEFPTWIVTNWGSDIYYFGRLASHKDRIKEVLSECDYYSCECQRDVHLGRQAGLKGEVLPVLPNTGGFDLERVAQLRQPGRPSERRVILLKGYHDWAGRALIGLKAIALAADALNGYRVGIYLANRRVRAAARSLSQSTGIQIDIIPFVPHEDMLRLYGQARISIGLSISDAASTSFLESIVMGAFPIQSCTACADEWITDGETGMIVPPEDPETVARAIRQAVSDDALVDRAAELNARTVKERLDQKIIRPQVIAMYERIAAEAKSKRGDKN